VHTISKIVLTIRGGIIDHALLNNLLSAMNEDRIGNILHMALILLLLFRKISHNLIPTQNV